MNRDEYLKMRAVEDLMWWYRGLHANLLAMASLPSLPPGPVLDAGCGTGGLLRRLREALGDRTLVGLDREPLAASLAAERREAAVALGSVDALPFPDGAFAAIFSADVLYHRNVDEKRALAEARRCLVPGGRLVVNLPAYDWMRSSHDEAVHGARRYTGGRIRRALAAAGFTRIVCRYWNFLLFPLMAAKRKMLPGGSSDVHPFPAPIEAVFRGLMRTETALIRRGIGFPFGGSIVAAATA